MSAALIGIVTLIYVCVSISLLRDGQNGMALAFFAYAVANVGLIWQAL